MNTINNTDELREPWVKSITDILLKNDMTVRANTTFYHDVEKLIQRIALEARKEQLLDIFNPDDFALTYEIKQDTVRKWVAELDSQLQELEK